MSTNQFVPGAVLPYAEHSRTVTTQDMPMGDFNYTIVKADVEVRGLMPIPEKAKGMPPTWGSYVAVDNVDATAAQGFS